MTTRNRYFECQVCGLFILKESVGMAGSFPTPPPLQHAAKGRGLVICSNSMTELTAEEYELRRMRRLLASNAVAQEEKAMSTPMTSAPTCPTCQQTMPTPLPKVGDMAKVIKGGYTGILVMVIATNPSGSCIEATMVTGAFKGHPLVVGPGYLEVVHGYIHIDRESYTKVARY